LNGGGLKKVDFVLKKEEGRRGGTP